jgi:hypothetical protein
LFVSFINQNKKKTTIYFSRLTNDLEPITLEFNKQSRKSNKTVDDDEENRQASESLFRSLPEIRYRYYVINAACIFFAILLIQALIFEK